MVFAFFIFLSRLILCLAEEEDFTVLTSEKVLLFTLTFKSTVNWYDGICNKGMITSKSAAFVSQELPV